MQRKIIKMTYYELGFKDYQKNSYHKAANNFLTAVKEEKCLLSRYMLFNMYAHGQGVSPSESKANMMIESFKLNLQVDKIRQKAEESDLIALTALGEVYEEGWKVEQSDTEALCRYQQAAEQNFSLAQCKLGYLIIEMVHIKEEPEEKYKEAFKWYKKAAENGYSIGQYRLSLMYETGLGVEQSDEKTFEWCKKAAESGYCFAQNYLGYLYCVGKGVEQSDTQTFYWNLQAAKQGLDSSQTSIAYAYLRGLGVDHSYEKAIEWYKKAAKQGDEEAQYMMGVCYYNGWGVQKSLEKATEWYKKAAENGHEGAIKVLSHP